MDSQEVLIRNIVSSFVISYAAGFSDKHIKEANDPDGTINMKINNIFIAVLGEDIQYYSALCRSLDSSLGYMIEKMAIQIASNYYEVKQFVEGTIYKSQTDFIAELLERYKRRVSCPHTADYKGITAYTGEQIHKRHESDYYLFDPESQQHMGVGSVGVAALRNKRKFIGVEINPTYFEAAKKRIETLQAVLKQPQ